MDSLFVEYVKSNNVILTKYFDERLKLFQTQMQQLTDQEKKRVVECFLENDSTVVIGMLDAQKKSASLLFGDNISLYQAPVLQHDPPAKIKADNSGHPGKVEIESWLKENISLHTGFPVERITNESNFEEELGLVSIDMVGLFSGLVEAFPTIDAQLVDIIGVTNINDLLSILVTENE